MVLFPRILWQFHPYFCRSGRVSQLRAATLMFGNSRDEINGSVPQMLTRFERGAVRYTGARIVRVDRRLDTTPLCSVPTRKVGGV